MKNVEKIVNNKGKDHSSKSILSLLVNLTRILLSGHGNNRLH